MNSSMVADQLEGLAAQLRTYPSTADELRALQAAENLIAARKADVARQMDDHADYEAEGFSTMKAWMRHELRLDTTAINALLSAETVLRDLPGARELAEPGGLTAGHCQPLAFALRHIEPQIIADNADWMLDLAAKVEPALLRKAVRRLRDVTYPDDLDEQWIKGMAKQDITVTAVPEGWHVKGFLTIQTGAKLATVLRSLSKPREAGDTRTAAQRRVEGLDELLSAVLADGLPTDAGVRPHLTVTIDLADILDHPQAEASGIGDLAGFGAIGPRQLQQMLCEADLTPILTGGHHTVLDVGRTQRLATTSQRKAISRQQHGQCAGPGCRHPIGHYHHLTPWSRGGPTNLANLIGLCARCHTATHQGHLTLQPRPHTGRRLTPRRARGTKGHVTTPPAG